jgi:hypothetical protein
LGKYLGKKKQHKKGWVEWLKMQALSSNSSTAKINKQQQSK